MFLLFNKTGIVNLLLLLLLINNATAQQNKIDNLLGALQNAKHDTATVNTLLKISKYFFNENKADSCMHYANNGFSLAEEISFKEGMTDALLISGQTYHRLKIDIITARKYYLQAKKIAEDIGYKKSLYRVLSGIAWTYQDEGNNAGALKYFLKSLNIAEMTGDKKTIATAHHNLGVNYAYRNNYQTALKEYFEALEVFQELKDTINIITSYFTIGIAYIQVGKDSLAIEYQFKRINLLEALHDSVSIAYGYNEIGAIYGAQKNYRMEMQYFYKALEIFKKPENQAANLQGIANTYNKLTGILMQLGEYEKVFSNAMEQLTISRKIRDHFLISSAYNNLTEYYKHKNDYKNAYINYQLYTQVKDSIFNEESSKQIAEMQTKYETEKKEQQIKLLVKEGELQKSEVRRQKFIIWSVAGGLLIVVVFSFFIFKERRKSEKLLLNILPVETARELKKKGKALPKYYELVTVLFTDFKGFTKIAEKMSVEDLVSELDFIFRKFDEIISRYPIEKIKTIGDAYMCAGGLPVANTTNPINVVMAALDIQQFVEDYKQQCIKEGKLFFEIRIGVHSGPIVAGVVGDKKFAYDIWGDTVNTASRMESSGEPGKVNISGSTYQLLQTFPKFKTLEMLNFIFRGKIPAKNKAEIEMWFVERNQ